jgi:plastocyanin
MRYIRLAIPLLAACLILAVTGLSALAQSSSAVTISDFQFSPASMQVAQGTTVTWTNNGPTNHTSTSDTGVWDSGVLPAGKSFSFKFNSPGTFAYHCAIHPNMKATITVTSSAGASAAASPSASQPAAPTQLPKTGGGAGQSSMSLLWLLALVPVAGAAFLPRFFKGEER